MRIFCAVLLPAPLEPRKPKISPRAICKLICFNAGFELPAYVKLRSLTSIMCCILAWLQAIEHKRYEYFREFLPALGNLLIAKQLRGQQTQERAGDGAYCQGHIDLAQVSFFDLSQKVLFSNLECRHNYLLVIQFAQLHVDQHFRQ